MKQTACILVLLLLLSGCGLAYMPQSLPPAKPQTTAQPAPEIEAWPAPTSSAGSPVRFMSDSGDVHRPQSYPITEFYASDAPLWFMWYKDWACEMWKIPPLVDPQLGAADYYGVKEGQDNVYPIQAGFGGETRQYALRVFPDRTARYYNLSDAGITNPILMYNGDIYDQDTPHVIYRCERDGKLTAVTLDFDYGASLSLPAFSGDDSDRIDTTYFVAGVEASPYRDEYLVVYAPSPYGDSDGSTYDNTRCKIRIAVFDYSGAKIRDFDAGSAYFKKTFEAPPGNHISWIGLGRSYFPVGDEVHFYLQASDYDGVQTESPEPTARYFMVDPAQGTSTPVSTRDFDAGNPRTFPFIVEYNQQGTDINILLTETEEETIATMQGDYVVSTYCLAPDNSFQVLFAPESSAYEPYRKSIHPARTVEKTVADLSGTAFIRGKTYTFARRDIYSFSMVLPDSFVEMEQHYVLRKYPSEDRPDTILTNPDSTINFTYSVLTDPEDTQYGIAQRVDHLAEVLEENGNSTILTTGVHRPNGIPVGYILHRSTALDGDIFNILFLFDDRDGNMVLGGFSCPYDDRNAWEPLVQEMLLTVSLSKTSFNNM